jgi:ACS family D-galactonate transporter-like MFS transporter
LVKGWHQPVTGALLADIAPRGIVRLTESSLYFVANIGGTLSPLIVGFNISATNSYTATITFISVVGLKGALAYIFLIGKVRRIEIRE